MPIPRAEFLERLASDRSDPALGPAAREAGRLARDVLGGSRGDFFSLSEIIGAIERSPPLGRVGDGMPIYVALPGALEGLVSAGDVETRVLPGVTYYALLTAAA
jgi:hypothetical protein